MVRILQSFLWILISLAAGYFLLVLLMYVLQSQLVYHPQKKITYTPDDIGLRYEDITFATDDNISLHGWHIPAERSGVTVLYFHGNAGNISGRLQTIQLLHELGLNVFIFDYRGYGKSKGTPTEQGTYQDAEAAWNYLTAQKNLDGNKIVIMGRSLGGAVASWLAARKNPGAVVIESTFTSAADLGADIYPWLPVRWMLKFEYNTLKNMKQIQVPLFMAHSVDDKVVPYHHGEQLFEVANEPKKFVELRGSHGSGFWETGDTYRQALQKFLTAHLKNQ
ncbi:alpha/beta hydrolase [Fodinibius sp. Rm-B-1B1-1]|uniref:alpha/beta hydrolase n=1 Tax=Fodinibius alkaliphilus TaxID=3140241 RepID=UPI003159A991